MTLPPELDRNTTPGRGFNKLLNLLEHYGPKLDRAMTRFTEGQNTYKGCMSSAALLQQLDKAPLYCLTPSANKRVRELYRGTKLETLPPIPELGFSVDRESLGSAILPFDDPNFEVFVRGLMDEAGQTILASLPLMFCNAGDTQVSDPSGKTTPAKMLEMGSALICVSHDKLALGLASYAMATIPHDTTLNPSCQLFAAAPGTALVFGSHLEHEEFSALNYASREAAEQMGPALHNYIFDDLKNVLMYLKYIDQPSHYVVEECRKGALGRTPRKLTARYDEREHWITIDPEEAKTRITERTDQGGTHASPLLHLRKAHQRTFRNERFKNVRGTTINIRPMWVGDREWANGRINYKVVSRAGSKPDQA